MAIADNYKVIPLTSEPNQSLTVTIPIGSQNITLNLKISYNSAAGYWVMTVKDKSNNILVDGIPLLCGQYPAGDLLEQYQYLNIGSAFILNLGNSYLDSPDDTTLGTDFVLVWGDSM